MSPKGKFFMDFGVFALFGCKKVLEMQSAHGVCVCCFAGVGATKLVNCQFFQAHFWWIVAVCMSLVAGICFGWWPVLVCIPPLDVARFAWKTAFVAVIDGWLVACLGPIVGFPLGPSICVSFRFGFAAIV